jgi:putative SOS response-associated peptidase YedK
VCGRYASARKAEDLAASFGIRPERVDGDLEADYNVAPTKPVFAVVERTPRNEDVTEPVRQLRIARWGLVPSWAKDISIGNRLINARVETATTKPAFRRAFAARRCLLPADGYYEWWAGTGPDGKQVKQPFFIRPRDGSILAMAGLYEFWRDPTAERRPDGATMGTERRPDGATAGRKGDDAWVFSVTVLTTSAEDSLGQLHDRMPLMVEPAAWPTWLDPARQDPDAVRSLLTPAAPGLLEAYPVSREVNDVRHEGPHLIDPIPVADLPGDVPALM